MGLFSKGGFFDKITRGIDKATGGIAGGVFNTVKSVGLSIAPMALNAIVPGAGTILTAALGPVLSGKSPAEQAQIQSAIAPAVRTMSEQDLMDIANAVKADGVIEVNEIEDTIMKRYPNVSGTDLINVAKSVTALVQLLVPTVTVNDSKSVTNISFMDKAKGFFGKYKWYVVGALVVCSGLYFFMGKSKRRRW